MGEQNPGGGDRQQDGRPDRGTGPLAGEPRPRRPAGAAARSWPRCLAPWLAWWVILMSLWVAVDDSFESDELLAGAGVAAVAALAAELVGNQAGLRLQLRARWLARALGLPGQVVQQTVLVFAVLARALVTGKPAPSGRFRELPVAYGGESPLGVTRRVLLTGALSLAPNEFVLGFDAERDVMITHQLVEER